jgi:Prokaryotic RING finger family 4
MNFTYIDSDPSALFSSLFRPIEEPIEAIPCELDQTWIDFEKDLGNFKSKYVKVQNELAQSISELNSKKDEVSVMKTVLDNVTSPGLKQSLEELIYKYESSEGISALTQQCGELKGNIEAMKKVLKDTNAERYAKFTCFVCMERNIDLFFDPCGHVICEPCWVRTRNKETCPGCRTRLHGARKIYTLS